MVKMSSTPRPNQSKVSGPKSYGWFKMALLLFVFIIVALGIGLIQAATISKEAFISRVETYLNFANPNYRFVYIYPGMRREEIVDKYSKILNWDEKDKRWFIASAPPDPENGGYMDGYFLAKSYFVEKNASGQEVGEMMHQEFIDTVSEKVLDSKTGADAELSKKGQRQVSSKNGKKEVISLDAAIRIGSIIQREAAGPQDMRLISGIMWNRLFAGMSLDMDATLQYAKGDKEDWWPKVTGKDKYLDSPYNTYQNKGLPPGAISNPSIDAINAAYNPQKTDCIFYLHDKNGQIHCTKDYSAHKANVDKYLK